MSIGINLLIENCYHVDMVEPSRASAWLMTKYLDWQRDRGELASMREAIDMLYDNNESPRRRFIEVSEQELFKAVIEMCKKLGISNSGLGDYNLAALVIECQRETKEKLKKIANAVDS